jgi:peptidyl-prolyl cis-trans isomerase C
MTETTTAPGRLINWLAVILAGLAAVFAALAFFGHGNGTVGDDWQARVNRAALLQTNKLYTAAIAEFVPLIDNPQVPAYKRANFAFTVGEMYQDQVGDYENAAAYFVRARALGPRPDLDHQIGRRLVECFENLGRSFDAARQLATYTAADEKQKPAENDVVVAAVGDREITMSEIEAELQKLPTSIQSTFTTPEQKIEFVRQYIGMELLYKSGVRKGIDREPEIQKQLADVKKQLVVDEILKAEIVNPITVTDADLDLFYRAHKADLFEGKEFAEVRPQVEQEYRRIKQREKYSELIDRLITAEPVTIYEERLR